MARSNSHFVAPPWLRCMGCCAGMAPLLALVTAECFSPSISMSFCTLALTFLFRFSLHTLITGTPPKSISEFVGDFRNGRIVAKERQKY